MKIPAHKNVTVRIDSDQHIQSEGILCYLKHRPNDLSDISIDPNWFLQPDNIWSADSDSPNFRDGTFTIGNFQLANQYEARQNVAGAYVMAEQSIAKILSLVYGVRLEYNMMFYRGQNSDGSERYLNVNTLSELNVLPALNVVMKATDKMNVRLGYSRTVARPSFKEKSIAEMYDPIARELSSATSTLTN